jgi:hypothetical protein
MIDGCDKPYLAAGYCSLHYQRVRRHGNAGTVFKSGRKRLPLTLAERIEKRIHRHEGHWFWTGGVNATKTPYFNHQGTNIAVRRWLYEKEKGALADNVRLRTTCGKRWCINPDHQAHKEIVNVTDE